MQERRRGQVSFLIHFERTSAVKLTVAILGLFIFFSAAVIAWISLRVFNRRRPPNMQALVWSAATTLGIVQLRQLYPNNPRIGISLDFIIFFPSLIASLLSSVVLTIMWVTRDDFQIWYSTLYKLQVNATSVGVESPDKCNFSKIVLPVAHRRGKGFVVSMALYYRYTARSE